MFDSSNSARVLRRIVFLALLGAIVGVYLIVYYSIFGDNLFCRVMFVPCCSLTVIGLVFGFRSIIWMFRWLFRWISRFPYPRYVFVGQSCLPYAITMIIILGALLFLVYFFSRLILIIGVLVGIILSIIELKRSEDSDNDITNSR